MLLTPKLQSFVYKSVLILLKMVEKWLMFYFLGSVGAHLNVFISCYKCWHLVYHTRIAYVKYMCNISG
jgi:hypothetical protein